MSKYENYSITQVDQNFVKLELFNNEESILVYSSEYPRLVKRFTRLAHSRRPNFAKNLSFYQFVKQERWNKENLSLLTRFKLRITEALV